MRVVFTAAVLILAGCQAAETEPAAGETITAVPSEADITLGNGENNAIATEGITRAGAVLTVPNVTIEKNGWLVLHPFRDGEPVRDEYTGSTLVKAGSNDGVTIDIGAVPADGDMFIMMLHSDVNDDGVFDFGDGKTVPDAPVFEGTTMIAHPIAAPADSGS
ncbi:hypothetical protein [Pontixanthobacter sp. CEM42]|uniref:DUF7282 domain-containing protein n=1 Tax=Pontixanthobacter sp. CEM42 TaxID=2792077 RepID=UPI001ADF31E6|nr:hypothetical protein [Pontixanthobacter sp. CEM42]